MREQAIALQRHERPIDEALRRVREPLWLTQRHGPLREAPAADAELFAPACDPSQLGDRQFCETHGVRYPYVSGAMARGIASIELVEAMGRAEMLGIFGAAGLPLQTIEQAVIDLKSRLGARPFGVNMIFSPQQHGHEQRLCELLLRHRVRLVSASAYVALTPHLLRYRFHGIYQAPDGRVVTPNRLMAKVSREELAEKFLAPPPDDLLRELVSAGHLSEKQAQLASGLPIAEDLTLEADSAGHTDNRPAVAALPQMIALRDRLQRKHRYRLQPRVGAAGGLATPWSVSGAFAMGAAYVLTGSVNQACVESGTSDEARALLAEARQADCAMAPAADMFEMGARVQVLKRGTMFALHANKLQRLYREHASIEQIPAVERKRIEERIFRRSLDSVWQDTAAFFAARDPEQLAQANADPKRRMALVFRWYLGLSSNWAMRGESARRVDYQIWCGPAMGAFNEWTRESHLAEPQNRRVVHVAHNLLYGAALATRLHLLRAQGADLISEIPIVPLPTERLRDYLGE